VSKLGRFFCLFAIAAATATAQTPAISSVVNAATWIPAPLPNAGIAQGAIFLILGSNLGPASVAVAPAAFTSSTLAGTSATVTVNGKTVNALMYYTSASQVAVLLPSNTPAGTGTISLSYNGKASAPAPITVVKNNLGIFTLSQNGSGPAIVTYPDYSLVSSVKAANPGDVLLLWATGLGPVPLDDASGPQPGNMPDIPLKLWLGGVSVPVTYQGRSGCCTGEDQIVFTVPANAPVGCAVPLSVQIGDQISNSTVMPVASSSRACSTLAAQFPPAVIQTLTNGGSATYSQIVLRRQPNSNAAGYNDNVDPTLATFNFPAQFQTFAGTYLDSQPLGTCLVYNNLNPPGIPPVTVLGSPDFGSSLTVNGPNGTKTVSGASLVLSADATYLSPGPYTVTAPGGIDIPSFTANITIPAWPVLTTSTTAPINRANPLTLNWTGGTANSFVEVDLGSPTDNTFTTGSTVVCTAPSTAGTMTIPAAALLALPVGSNGFLEFKPTTNPVTFPASGLDVRFIQSYNDTRFLGLKLQ
jgi:uncharacterized protein (TIGR03437 family)